MERTLEDTISSYDHMAQVYFNKTLTQRPHWEFTTFCTSVIPQGHVLDVGCGGGRDSRALVEQGFSVTGIDLSMEMVKLARIHAPEGTFFQADMRSIPCEDYMFDGIWCCASLLHLDRIQIYYALIEFKRVLKRGGSCCLVVKEGQGEEIVYTGSIEGMPRFFTYFQEDELSGQCIDLGFTILQSRVRGEMKRSRPSGRIQNWIYLLIRKL